MTQLFEQTNNYPRRFIGVCGGRGGAGVTAFARFLLDEYRYRAIPCRAYDSNLLKPDLHRFYARVPPGVELLDFTVRGEADVMLDVLHEQASPILVDFPAHASQGMYDFLDDLDFVAEAAKCGYRLTFCFVLSRDISCVNALQKLTDKLGSAVDYVVIRNLHFGESGTFSVYNNSRELRPRLLRELGATEVDMPDLHRFSWDPISTDSLPFRAAAKVDNSWLGPTPLPISAVSRTRTHCWLGQLEHQIEPAWNYLGISLT